MTVVVDVILVPPLDAVNQPANVCPGLEVVANVPYVELYATVLYVGFGVVPPFSLNITVSE